MSDNNPKVSFPDLSQIVDSRRDLVWLLEKQFRKAVGQPSDEGNPPLVILCGGRTTNAIAGIYRGLIETRWNPPPQIELIPLERAPEEKEANRVATHLLSKYGRNLPMVAYVGGQSVGDAAKVIVKALRPEDPNPPSNPLPRFGGIITMLSNDGVFTSNATVNDEAGFPKSVGGVPPDFILGHRLTLLRQPYPMKCACIGDMLATLSSLWDYEYSCRALDKYHNDFAADLARSAYEGIANRSPQIDRAFLHQKRSTDVLFRAVQLSGLSMQLLVGSETCSGSEHVGLKWLERFIAEYNALLPTDAHIRQPEHGIAVFLMTLVTAYMQGQGKDAEALKEVASRVGLPLRVSDLAAKSGSGGSETPPIPAKVVQASIALGLGFRCPRYVAREILNVVRHVPESEILENERVTVLEEVEHKILVKTIKSAMVDAGVADESEFDKRLTEEQREALSRVAGAARDSLYKAVYEAHGADPEVAKRVSSEVSPVFMEVLNDDELLPKGAR